MNLSHNRDLYDELFMQIARMHDEVSYRKHLNDYQGRRGKRKDFPAVSVGAEIDDATGVGHHHDYSNEKDFHPLILHELLERLGDLNKQSDTNPACPNCVGHCAENYAASIALKRIDPQEKNQDNHVLSDMAFTKAFQPRTWKNREWCANCRTMFD
ncbi:hypothetical protein [Prevotella sp. MA2016]|uniref:hypothetical protein n=1 Tax=Prevotella sp. MA2016 TaxID=1408310 RepID=UPI000491639C|nr:hypothetical protein [Prevotella sp. MA2016]